MILLTPQNIKNLSRLEVGYLIIHSFLFNPREKSKITLDAPEFDFTKNKRETLSLDYEGYKVFIDAEFRYSQDKGSSGFSYYDPPEESKSTLIDIITDTDVYTEDVLDYQTLKDEPSLITQKELSRISGLLVWSETLNEFDKDVSYIGKSKKHLQNLEFGLWFKYNFFNLYVVLLGITGEDLGTKDGI